MNINRLCVIGVGLIGGSLARALRSADCCAQIVGCGRNPDHLARAVELGVIDTFETDVAAAVAGSDMVVVAVPLGAVDSVFRAMAGSLADGAVLTDVGSAKGSVITAARDAFGELPAHFVPGHPIAGTEDNGVEASFDALFRDRRVILTPQPETDSAALARVRTMWEATGAKVVEMDPVHHDDVLAATSHLPHVLAFALVDVLASRSDRGEIFEFAAGGFRDFTRIASSDPVMWRDICRANSESLVSVIETFQHDLEVLRQAIRDGDDDVIEGCFRSAKEARDRFSD